MSGIMDKAKEAMGNKENSMGQPGDNVERKADDSVNTQVNDAAGQAGMPAKDDGMLDKFVDNKVNSDIPGGN